MTMKLLREAAVPKRPDDLVARESWGSRLGAAVVLATLACGAGGLIGLLLFGGDVTGWRPELSSLFGLALYGVIGLIALVTLVLALVGGAGFLNDAIAAMKPGNWVLRASQRGLYIKLRHFADGRLPSEDPVVAFVARRDVRWLRGHDQLARRLGWSGESRSGRDDALAKQVYLEIDVAADLAAISDRLEQERRAWIATAIPGIRRRALGAGVSVRPDGVLRIDWRTRATRLKPKLKDVLADLARAYPLAADLATEQQQAQHLDHAAQEQRLIDMARQGNMIDAVVIARDLYGVSTTEAKQEIERLMEPGRVPDNTKDRQRS